MIETVVVLAIISVMGLLLISRPIESQSSKVNSLQKQFGAFYYRMKSQSIGSKNGVQMNFGGHQITAANRTLEIDNQLHFENKTLEIKNDGYVQPTTIHVYNSSNQLVAKIIYSLGFGNFRFEKE